MLSENDAFFNQPDSNKDALFHLLLRIAGRPSHEVDTFLKVHRQARTLTSSNESIFKDKAALMLHAQPYIFQGQREKALYKPTLVYQWQSCAREVCVSLWCFCLQPNLNNNRSLHLI